MVARRAGEMEADETGMEADGAGEGRRGERISGEGRICIRCGRSCGGVSKR
jgi:hypothetical protein